MEAASFVALARLDHQYLAKLFTSKCAEGRNKENKNTDFLLFFFCKMSRSKQDYMEILLSTFHSIGDHSGFFKLETKKIYCKE